MQGMAGNEQQSIEKRYFGDGAGAARAVCKRSRVDNEVFWPEQRENNGRYRLWHTLNPQ
jgi:hypothetical protein